MPNPNKAVDGDGCIVHAGILKSHGGDLSKAQLTDHPKTGAKQKFIQAVKDELSGNSGFGFDFPCGKKNPPIPPEQLADLDLENEEKFPDFHKNILGHYLEVAKSLDAKSQFTLLPICDPTALAKEKFGKTIKIGKGNLEDFIAFAVPNIPLLALKLELKPPELAAKLPKLMDVPPKIPTFKINLPTLPQLTLPGFSIPGFTLLDFQIAFQLKMPDFMPKLLAKMPSFILKIVTLNIPGVLGDVCKLIAEDSKMFGDKKQDDEGNTQDTLLNASRKVLAKKTAEMSLIHAMSQTIGSSPTGLVGGFTKIIGYEPALGEEPPPKENEEDEIRDRMMSYALSCDGLSYSRHPVEYTRALFYKEATSPENTLEFKQGMGSAATVYSCGCFARAVLRVGGAQFWWAQDKVFKNTEKQAVGVGIKVPNNPGPEKIKVEDSSKVIMHDYFNDYYYPRYNVINDLIAIARVRKAFREKYFKNGVWPPNALYNTQGVYLEKGDKILRGDIIIVRDEHTDNPHVGVVTDDYTHGVSNYLETVDGGQTDRHNIGTTSYQFNEDGSRSTAIRKKRHYTPTGWLAERRNPNAWKSTTNFGSLTEAAIGNHSMWQKPGSAKWWLGLAAPATGRPIQYVINSYKFIKAQDEAIASKEEQGLHPTNSRTYGAPDGDVVGQVGPDPGGDAEIRAACAKTGENPNDILDLFDKTDEKKTPNPSA